MTNMVKRELGRRKPVVTLICSSTWMTSLSSSSGAAEDLSEEEVVEDSTSIWEATTEEATKASISKNSNPKTCLKTQT